jgi:magnesium transporter
MVAGVPRTRPAASAGECLEELRGVSPAQASVVAVFDGELLVGLLSVEHLATADPRTAVSELMVTPPASVDPETPIESAAAVMIAHDQTAVVVARPGEALLGIVPPERLARVLLAEHEEDMARIGGCRAGSRNAIRAAEEPLVARLWHRLPWLVVGLAGAMASVLIVGSFEEQLNEVVLLAFFVPAVVYMADSVGTQTETLLIRALAANVHVGRVIARNS